MLQQIPKNQQYQKQMNLEFLKQAIKNHPISHTNNYQNVEKIKINEYINNNNINKNINNSKKKQEQRSHTHSVVSHHIKLQNHSSFSTLDPENQSTTQNTSPKKKCQQSSYFHSSINSQYINKQQQQKLQENQTQKNEKETNQEGAYLPKNFIKNIKNQNKYNLNKNQTTQQFFQPRKNHFSAQIKSYSHSNFSSFDLNNSTIQQNQPQQQQNQLQFSNLSNQQQQKEDQKQQEQFFSSNDITIQSIQQEKFLASLDDEISCQSLLFSENPTNQKTNIETQENQFNEKEENQQGDQYSQNNKNQKKLAKDQKCLQFKCGSKQIQQFFFDPKKN
ncbi:hypothetical protein PPERSA_08354 [Pseudocohnilembus persalinus]|uniref:Uncharacterized protein n=1 Tax=Pseudocohnilembus persalinus TaxID=266149 RepID=A0A0V0QPE4_PSEPJ|nr:hypothetical protein PPERSA_08354 [Pseudocohnilembus persalinus]|eukprot:KRX04139.1 hypothetical protein PPERSA_08354 [Pseudocohnilembus persalinus]